MKARSLLTEGPVTRSLLAFALPAIAATILQSLNMSINAMWVGHLVGHQGLAATANVNMIAGLVMMMTFGFGTAVTILIARAMGAGDIEGMRRNFGAGLGIFTAAGIGLAIAGELALHPVLHKLDMPADVYPLAADYARISFAALPITLLFISIMLALRGIGDAKTPLLFIGVGAVLDVGLNPLLILGLGSFPRMGIAGSAMASLIASSVSLVLLILYVYARDLPVRLRGTELRHIVPPMRLVMTILKQGVPMGIQMMVTSAASLVMMTLVNNEGTATVAAYAAVAQLWIYIQMPATGLGGAAGTMVAHNIGAGRWDRVDHIAAASAALGFGITLFVALLMLGFDRQALGLFLDARGSSMDIASHINLCATWSFMLYGALLPLVVIPRANGASIAPLIIMTIMFIPGRLGFAYLLRPTLGVDAIWWSFPVSFFIAGILILGYYRYGNWRSLDVLHHATSSDRRVQES